MKIEFITANGVSHAVDAEPGQTLMQVAVDNLVPGIDATCGGDCSCGTCQCYVDQGWFNQLNPKSETEAMMLEHALHVQENSRLACQVVLTDAQDGMVVRVPVSQF